MTASGDKQNEKLEKIDVIWKELSSKEKENVLKLILQDFTIPFPLIPIQGIQISSFECQFLDDLTKECNLPIEKIIDFSKIKTHAGMILELDFLPKIHLKNVPATLSRLYLLYEFRAQNVGLEEFPSELDNLHYLNRVNLEQNNLTQIPELKSKSYFNFDKNQIAEISSKIVSGYKSSFRGNPIIKLIDWKHDREEEVLRILEIVTGSRIEHKHNVVMGYPGYKKEEGKITTLSIQFHSEIWPAPLFELGDLDTLKIFSSQVKEIPEEIRNFTKLRRLYIQDCQIEQVPDYLIDLTQLEELHLNGNKIHQFPFHLINHPHLKMVNLENNRMKMPFKRRDKITIKEIKEKMKEMLGDQREFLPEDFVED